LKESLDTGEFHEHTINIFSGYSQRKFVNKEENFAIFEKLIPNLHIIEFYGGEPFMQPEHKKIIQILDNYPDIHKYNLELFYNTNGTHYDPELTKVWDKMGLVEFNISVDDIGERFEYQRHPAKWDEVVKNINLYQTNAKKNLRLGLYCTVSLYNIFYIDEFLRFNRENFQAEIRFNLLHWPNKMSIKNLPTNVKKIINSKIESIDPKDLVFISSKFGLKEIIDFMNNNDASEDEFKNFLAVTELHDQYRKESFKKTFHEYWRLFND